MSDTVLQKMREDRIELDASGKTPVKECNRKNRNSSRRTGCGFFVPGTEAASPGTSIVLPSYPGREQEELWRRNIMPVFILWAVPAIIVIGGGVYLIGHMH